MKQNEDYPPSMHKVAPANVGIVDGVEWGVIAAGVAVISCSLLAKVASFGAQQLGFEVDLDPDRLRTMSAMFGAVAGVLVGNAKITEKREHHGKITELNKQKEIG
jgi:hypothetical protein